MYFRRPSAILLLSGLTFAAAYPIAAIAQNAPATREQTGNAHAGFIAEASQRFGIPIAWIRAVMRAESADAVRAISPAGAMGLMQIMPDTWAGLRIRYHLGNNPYDPHDNILAGTAYLRELHDRYGAPGFLAAYNAGPRRYDEYLATGRPLPAETRAYLIALAPTVGGGKITDPVIAVAADPLSWTRAPLFFVRADRTFAAAPAHSGNTPAAPSQRDTTADEQPRDSLFVPHSDAGKPQ
ncbi:lytic transglycosylase domain-containing protein [Acidomonas methanolica]|uniref:Lytic transglycosylase n=2 Tax=Acidomonas methanolica TaxID=437 RepID=A0A023D600_ACIMT|nr:lytic transglycosylase domain-containing protein [Acidomonas methanolica]TCS25748.1 transglycosylase-like protein with SLT domain [Acidomonas methanolica]GAJ29598.1 lytic transglycosylase [Acidomonas methanolica NBRC 104435]GBQ57816.1 murein transglycosylase [Acidomonas methanolica]GEK99358.1 transglycosylase [Acidomonas methanolica NBRC 104435]